MPATWRIPVRIIAVITLILCAPAAAKEPPVKLDVVVGFHGVYRAGAWTPVYLTLQSATPRAVLIELSMPHDASHTMRITSLASVSADAATLAMVAPLPADLQLASVVVRDAASGRALTDATLDRSTAGARFASDFDDLVIGFAGGITALPPRIELGNLSGATALALGALPANRLPAAAVAYDSLDLLILGAPDLARMDLAAQQAIADWVYAGGSLLFWPGTDPLPAASPIMELLPADVGENALAAIGPDMLQSFGLPTRFARLPVRQLAPRPGARSIAPMGESAAGFWIDRGLGRVMILPFEPSALLMQGQGAHQRLWRPIFARLVGEARIAETADGTNMNAFSNMNAYLSGFGQNNAIDAAINLIGNIPGMGRFGFSYVLVVLLGLMIVVGPVDWLVLKKLGRQPWTLYTTAGWIALVTLGAVYAGSLLRSGDLHLRTLELIEQAGDRVVARSHVSVIYSPRTQRYELSGPPTAWWRPGSAQMNYYVGGGLKQNVAFRQSAGGNLPVPASIPVWSMRFLRGDEIAPPDAPPWIHADLSIENRAGKPFLTGALRNAGSVAIQIDSLTTRAGAASAVGAIAPGASLALNLPLRPSATVAPNDDPTPELGQWAASDAARAIAIDPQRQSRLTRRLTQEPDVPPIVCVVATTAPEPASPLSLVGQSPKVEHRRIIRATLPLRSEVTP